MRGDDQHPADACGTCIGLTKELLSQQGVWRARGDGRLLKSEPCAGTISQYTTSSAGSANRHIRSGSEKLAPCKTKSFWVAFLGFKPSLPFTSPNARLNAMAVTLSNPVFVVAVCMPGSPVRVLATGDLRRARGNSAAALRMPACAWPPTVKVEVEVFGALAAGMGEPGVFTLALSSGFGVFLKSRGRSIRARISALAARVLSNCIRVVSSFRRACAAAVAAPTLAVARFSVRDLALELGLAKFVRRALLLRISWRLMLSLPLIAEARSEIDVVLNAKDRPVLSSPPPSVLLMMIPERPPT